MSVHVTKAAKAIKDEGKTGSTAKIKLNEGQSLFVSDPDVRHGNEVIDGDGEQVFEVPQEVAEKAIRVGVAEKA